MVHTIKWARSLVKTTCTRVHTRYEVLSRMPKAARCCTRRMARVQHRVRHARWAMSVGTMRGVHGLWRGSALMPCTWGAHSQACAPTRRRRQRAFRKGQLFSRASRKRSLLFADGENVHWKLSPVADCENMHRQKHTIPVCRHSVSDQCETFLSSFFLFVFLTSLILPPSHGGGRCAGGSPKPG